MHKTKGHPHVYKKNILQMITFTSKTVKFNDNKNSPKTFFFMVSGKSQTSEACCYSLAVLITENCLSSGFSH